MYIFVLFVPLYFRTISKKDPEYNNLHERFGLSLVNNSTKPIIWIHAVSVGETRAIAQLIELISQDYPQYQILITQMTSTGRATAANLYPNAMLHYIPFDMPHAIINFYKTFKPKLGLIMETEIWPNLIYYAKNFNVPLYLINARLSDRSYKSYSKIKFFIKPILNNFNGILCQDQLTADNFKKLGYNRNLSIVGNIKFDMLIDNSKFAVANFLMQNLWNESLQSSNETNKLVCKKVIVFASTRDGEEQLILDSIPLHINYLIVIVPRHPERFLLVENLIKETKKFKYQKRSDNKPIEGDTQIFIGNSLGEMLAYYKMADIAVIGGSFANFGGQNLIEPIYMDTPVIIGQYTYNFAKVTADAIKSECVVQVGNIEECFHKINELLTNPDKYIKMVTNCSIFAKKYQGSSKRIMDIIKSELT
jgi:3-deoxy-D-manno-octulosonic-acid transferase